MKVSIFTTSLSRDLHVERKMIFVRSNKIDSLPNDVLENHQFQREMNLGKNDKRIGIEHPKKLYNDLVEHGWVVFTDKYQKTCDHVIGTHVNDFGVIFDVTKYGGDDNPFDNLDEEFLFCPRCGEIIKNIKKEFEDKEYDE